MRVLLALLCAALFLLAGPPFAQAAEVLQVRSGTLLQVGDQNRTYTVQLACILVSEEQNAAATAWLRAELPRRSKVNLRPMGQDAGVMLAQVQKLGRSTPLGTDLATGLVMAGLATASCPASEAA